MMETNDIVREVAAEMLNTSMQEITAERIHGWATRLGATCKESLQVGNSAKMREALKYLRDALREFCHLILNSKYNEVYDKYKHPEVAKISDAIANAGLVLAEPPRNCDIMSLETARKVWFAKEIVPRLNGDLPLGKEVPFEEWFVSQQEKGEAK